jgi:hypothetical protein
VRGLGDARRPFRIVAEKQQAFAGAVQPSHRREPRQAGAIEAAVHGVAPLVVADGGDEAARLVEREIAARSQGQRRTVQRHAIHAVRHGMFRVAHHAPVHRDAPVGHPRGRLRARTHAGLGEHARHPDAPGTRR